jgi:DNA repair exonuclease SbcCD ATPase subunit
MNIKLLQIRLNNFKGVKSFSASLSSNIINIFGANESGKSTLADAWFWLLFGKNQAGDKDFSIKTLDANNNPIHKLDHEVEALLNIDGSHVKIKRSFREKWVKKKGEETPVWDGHETSLFWNEVPLSQGEFTAKVNQICQEDVFKLLTNTNAFSGLHWQKRRAILFEIAGEVKDSDIAVGRKDFQDLINSLNGKTLSEYKREISAKKKLIKDELALIPGRIDEVKRQMPEKTIDAKQLKAELEAIDAELKAIDLALTSKQEQENATATAYRVKQAAINSKKQAIQSLEYEDRKRKADQENEAGSQLLLLSGELSHRQSEVKNIESEMSRTKLSSKAIEDSIEKLRAEWKKVDDSQLDLSANHFDCPACKRPLEDADQQRSTLIANFNTDKSEKLSSITTRGQQLKKELTDLQSTLADLTEVLTAKNNELAEVRAKIEVEKENVLKPRPFDPNPEIAILIEEIKSMEAELKADESSPRESNSNLLASKSAMVSQRDSLMAGLNSVEAIKKANLRIDELEESTKKMAQEIASLEKIEFVIEGFTKAKIDSIEASINSKFRMARFKMFNNLINGGVEEVCEVLYKGVPFPDLNTASKINVGLDIISALGSHYDVKAPVWVDNRESVSAIIDVDFQVINLIVSPDDKVLRVN